MPGARKTFSRKVLAAIDERKILGVRAGPSDAHRFTGVWPVVVRGRVFVRSWTLKPGGWYRTLLENPRGAIHIADRELPVRAFFTRGERLKDEVEAAYATKYTTPHAQKYVRGFRRSRRRNTTTELRPR